jgi:hypothetical protein
MDQGAGTEWCRLVPHGKMKRHKSTIGPIEKTGRNSMVLHQKIWIPFLVAEPSVGKLSRAPCKFLVQVTFNFKQFLNGLSLRTHFGAVQTRLKASFNVFFVLCSKPELFVIGNLPLVAD